MSGIPLWPSRDPIGELGGVNLYGFIWNDGVNGFDLLGLELGKLYDDVKQAIIAGGTFAVEESEKDLKNRQEKWKEDVKAVKKKFSIERNSLGALPETTYEFGGRICCKDVDGQKKYYHTNVVTDSANRSIGATTLKNKVCEEGDKTVGLFHNHPNNATEREATLSDKDMNLATKGYDYPNKSLPENKKIPPGIWVIASQRHNFTGKLTHDVFNGGAEE